MQDVLRQEYDLQQRQSTRQPQSSAEGRGQEKQPRTCSHQTRKAPTSPGPQVLNYREQSILNRTPKKKTPLEYEGRVKNIYNSQDPALRPSGDEQSRKDENMEEFMMTSETLFDLLRATCRRAARYAADEIEGYDLATVSEYLDREDVRAWKDGEIIANLDLRTTVGLPDRSDPEQMKKMRGCYERAVAEVVDAIGEHA